MDDDQQFCLRWNNHQSTLISVFDTLLENETLVDCTLAAEGKFLKAHKVVLSACSPYFATLLSEQYDKHPIFILKDVKYQELRAMMDYMYRGEVNISQDQLAALLKAAESLQIKGLSDNRTGSGNSSSGLGVGGSQQQQQQKLSAEQQQQQHKHISVPGKLMTGSASAGYTLEQTKRSRIGPSSIDSQDLSGSREGSSSPTSRRRKKVRRRSIENVLADNHDNSNSSQVIQAGTSLVPTTNATGTITAMLPMVGSGVAGTTTTIAGTIASTVSAVTSSLQQQHQQQQQQQQQQASAASAAANIITANVTKKTESVKMGGNTDAMNAAVQSIDNIQDENAADSIDEKEMLMKEKQNHKRPKHHHEGGGVVATSTGKDEIVIEPKSEYDDEGNDETVEDLTLDDEEMGLEDLDHNAGPSHGGEGSSQGYAQWQVDRSQDEVYMAAQEAQQRDPQDLSKKVINQIKDQKNSIMEHHRNVNNRHSINGMEAMSAANQINGNKKRFSVSDVSDMLYEFYRANSAAKAPKTENTDKSFRQKSPSSADAAAGGKSGSMQSGMPNEPQTSNTSTTASKNSNGDEMTNTNNKIGTTKSSISVRKNTSSFHPRVKYSSVVNKSSAAAAAAAAAALANMENTPAAIPTSVVVPPPDIKPILPIPASVIKAPIVGGATAAPAAAAIAAALLRDGYHNFQQQLRNQDIFKQQSNLVPLAHNNQSGGSVQPISGQSKSLTFDSFDRKENHFSENDNDSNSEFDEDDDDDDDDGRYSGFDDIHLIEGSKSSFNNHPNATMPCLSTDYMSDESQKLMMAAQAQALRHLEYSLSDYGGTNPNEEANYQCRHCGKKYRWKSTLRRHENVECGGKEPAHQCPYCAYKSKQRGNLGVHVRKHHSNLPQLASKRRSKYSQQREVKIEKTEKAF